MSATTTPLVTTGGPIVRHTTGDAIASVRDGWLALSPRRLDADPDYLAAVSAVRPEVISPYVAMLEQAGSPTAMAVGRLETYALPCKVGYQRIRLPKLRTITIVDGGMLGELAGGHAERLVRELIAVVDSGEVEALAFHRLPVGSPAHAAVLRVGDDVSRRRFRVDAARPRWLLDLPASREDYLRSRSRSTRESLRRYEKKFEKDFAGRIEVRRFETADDLDTMITDMEPVAAKSYQRSLGVGFADNREFRELIELGMRRGWFRAWVLYVDGVSSAFWFGFGYAGVFSIGSPGYDPALGDYRVGNYVHLRMIDDLCHDPTISSVDYGTGDAEYKRRFGSTSSDEQDVLLFGRGLRPLGARLGLDVAAGVNRAAKAVLRGRQAEAIRRRWRHRSSRHSARAAAAPSSKQTS
jgi:Acetyltransferase (GNAT) domain